MAKKCSHFQGYKTFYIFMHVLYCIRSIGIIIHNKLREKDARNARNKETTGNFTGMKTSKSLAECFNKSDIDPMISNIA